MLEEKEVLALYKLDQKIKELNTKKAEITSKLFKKYGETQGVVKLEGVPKPYLRVKIKDNLPKIEEGEAIFKSTGFTRFEVDVSLLKNPPKA